MGSLIVMILTLPYTQEEEDTRNRHYVADVAVDNPVASVLQPAVTVSEEVVDVPAASIVGESHTLSVLTSADLVFSDNHNAFFTKSESLSPDRHN